MTTDTGPQTQVAPKTPMQLVLEKKVMTPQHSLWGPDGGGDRSRIFTEGLKGICGYLCCYRRKL